MKPYFNYFKQDLPKKEGNNKGFEIISSLTVTKSPCEVTNVQDWPPIFPSVGKCGEKKFLKKTSWTFKSAKFKLDNPLAGVIELF